MKHIKRILIAGILLIVMPVVASVVWIDQLARVAIEKGATYAMGVDTTLQGLNIGLLSGEAGMTQLHVANPSGFETPHFLELGEGTVAVSLGSLKEDTVVVPTLALSHFSVNLENKMGKSNYKVILDELKRFESKKKNKSAEEGGKRFIVNHVTMDDIDVQVDMLPTGGKLTRLPLKIERIELRDIGSESDGGVQMAELTNILLQALLTSIAQKGGSVLPAEINAELTKGLHALGGLGEASFKVIGDMTTIIDGQVQEVGKVGQALLEGIGQGGKEIDKGLKDLTKGLDGLFQKPKKESDRP